MSGKASVPAGPGLFLGAAAFGLAVSGGCLAGMAALMESRGLVQGAAWPLSTLAVCMGSLLGGWLAALLQKSRRLLYGAAEGAALAAVLAVLQMAGGSLPAGEQLLRLLLVVLAGACGGLLGLMAAGGRGR